MTDLLSVLLPSSSFCVGAHCDFVIGIGLGFRAPTCLVSLEVILKIFNSEAVFFLMFLYVLFFQEKLK